MESKILDVENCSACGGSHKGLVFSRNLAGEYVSVCPISGATIYVVTECRKNRVVKNKVDVTDQVSLDAVDGEYCSILKCVCGAKFNYAEQWISIYSDDWKCPKCGVSLYFTHNVVVYREV